MIYLDAEPTISGSGASAAQASAYVARSATATGPASYRTWRAKLIQADGSWIYAAVSATLAAQINAAPQTVYYGGTATSAAQPGTVQASQTLILDNLDAAQAIADAWPMYDPAGQGRGLRDYAASLGMRPDLTDIEARAAVAKMLATIADEARIDLVAELNVADVPTGSQGFFDSAKRLVQHPLKWANNVISEIGKGLQQLGDNVLNARKIGPLGQYFLDPLGFSLQAQLIKQFGNVLEAGSISAFDERELSYTASSTFTAAGQALLVAAPFIPQPFGTAAMLVGAASVAAGKMLRVVLDQRKGLRTGIDPDAPEAGPEQPDGEATVNVDVPEVGPRQIHYYHFPTRGWQPVYYYDGSQWQPLQEAA